ncbi:MAG TPA: hypothetical protein PKH89_00425, partial [Anaerolineae bacterium]|nr:hypothetical protein [Anaerolineae bacterium]
MKRWLLALAALLIVLVSMPAAVQAQDPVTLNKSDYYVTVLQDGRLRVKYELTFTERENGRDRIKELPPLESPHTILEAYGSGPDGRFQVTLQPTGRAGVYSALFATSTRKGSQYVLTVRYTVDRSVFDATKIDGEDYRIIGWASGEWSLGIEVLGATFVLPIELPADITRPEQVTDAIVNAAGVKVGRLSDFTRWVYFPTPDETTGKNWLSIYVEKKNVPPKGKIQPPFYLRGSTIPTTSETEIPLKPSPTPVQPSGGTGWTRAALGLIFCMGMIVVLGVAVVVALVVKRRPKKPVYEPPEIELETFETAGVVPDLNAIETAFYMGNSARTITLIVLSLVNRG